MSGPGAPAKSAPSTVARAAWRLHILLWPFATAAVAVNLFLLGLIGLSLGLPAIPPVAALWLALPLGLPATWVAACWVRRLIAEAEAVRPSAAPGPDS